MKKNKIIYWVSTSVVGGVMLWSALYFSIDPEMKSAFARLGLPDWFRMELTIAKILGAFALLIPIVPAKIKEFAYFGFAITLISAAIAHFSSGDGIVSLEPLGFLVPLAVSYAFYNKVRFRMSHEASEYA